MAWSPVNLAPSARAAVNARLPSARRTSARAWTAACPTAIEIVITRIAAKAWCVAEIPRPATNALRNRNGTRLRNGIWYA